MRTIYSASTASDVNGVGVFGYSSLPAPKAFWDFLTSAGGRNDTESGARAVHWEKFDHAFFGMSKDLAGKTDPQLRKLLECTYHALLRAGRTQFDDEVRAHRYLHSANANAYL